MNIAISEENTTGPASPARMTVPGRARQRLALVFAGALIVAGGAAQSRADQPGRRADLEVPIAQLLDRKLARQLANLPLRVRGAAIEDRARDEWGRPISPAALSPKITLMQAEKEKSS